MVQSYKRSNLKEISWILAYGFYALISIGLIIVSAITLRFGKQFFGNVAAGNGNSNATGGTNGGGGDDENGEESFGSNLTMQDMQRLHAEATSSVMSSLGVALGVLALVLNLVSFAAQSYLDWRWRKMASLSELSKKYVVAVIICTINAILAACGVALAVGFALSAHDLSRFVTDTSSATPGYLISACVMAVLTAAFAILTIVADVAKFKIADAQSNMDSAEQPLEEEEVKVEDTTPRTE